MGQMKWKALVSTLAAVSIVATGCGGGKTDNNGAQPTDNNTPAPTANYGDTGGLKLPLVDKPTTLTWMMISDHPNLSESPIIKELEKRTGIKLDIQAYSSQTFQDKLKVVVAGSKLPDIFHGLTIPEVNKMGAQKALAPINEYLNILPNFKKLYVDDAENSWVMKSWSDDKNNLYSWPIYGLNRDVNHGFLYRKDIFDKHGIKEWTNTEEFYDAVKKLKAAYPQSYPIASKTKEYIFRDWAYGWGVGSDQFPLFYEEKTKTWKLAYTTPEFKQQLDFMKKLYEEGLLDPEFISDTDASWTAKMTTNNKSFITFDWIGRLESFATQVKSQNPDYNLRYGNPVGPTEHVRSLPKISNYGTVVSNGPNKELALKLLDYLSSPSGAELITMGIEGSMYKLENGKPVYPEMKDVANIDIKALEKKYGMWVEGMYFRPDKRSVYFNFTEKEQEAQDKINNGKKYEPADPILKFTDAESKVIADLRTTIEKAGNEFNTKYVMKKEFGETQWNEWLQNVEKLGASKLVDAFNSAQKRYDETK